MLQGHCGTLEIFMIVCTFSVLAPDPCILLESLTHCESGFMAPLRVLFGALSITIIALSFFLIAMTLGTLSNRFINDDSKLYLICTFK